jgi:hypothetical protein
MVVASIISQTINSIFFLKFDIFTNRKAKEGNIHKIDIEFSILDEKYRKIDVHLTIG